MDKAVFDLYKGKIFFCLVSLQFLAGPVIIESKYGSPKICPHLVIILHNFFFFRAMRISSTVFLFAIQSMRNYMSGPVILGWGSNKTANVLLGWAKNPLQFLEKNGTLNRRGLRCSSLPNQPKKKTQVIFQKGHCKVG